jgi:hypothetical protein
LTNVGDNLLVGFVNEVKVRIHIDLGDLAVTALSEFGEMRGSIAISTIEPRLLIYSAIFGHGRCNTSLLLRDVIL